MAATDLLDRVRRQAKGRTLEQLREDLLGAREALREFDRSRPLLAERAHLARRQTIVDMQGYARSRIATDYARMQSPAFMFPSPTATELLELAALAGASVLDEIWREEIERALAAGTLSATSVAEEQTERKQLLDRVDELERAIRDRGIQAERARLEARLAELGDDSVAVGEREQSGMYAVLDAASDEIFRAAYADLERWRSDQMRRARVDRHNAGVDHVAYEAPRYTVVPVDVDGHPIFELAEEWAP